MNHFAKCCRSSRKGSAVGEIQQPNESAPFILSVNSVTNASKPFKICSLQLADTMVTLIIDIGTKVSILNDSLYRKHFSGYHLHPPEGTLSTYDSSEIPLEGMVHLPVTYQSETIQNFPFYVTRSGSSLMGLDLFDQLGFQVSKNGVIIQSVDMFQHFTQCSQVLGKLPGLFTIPELNRKLHLCHKVCVAFHSLYVRKCHNEKDEPCKSMTDDYVMEQNWTVGQNRHTTRVEGCFFH